jgi:Ca-activated chloride channel family protein
MTRRHWLLAGAGTAFAQQSIPIFRSDVRLVRLLINVRDPSGHLVGGLEKSDFTVQDSGVPQQISIFERQTEVPLSIALMVDTSGSTAKDLKYELDSASRFVKAVVREGHPADSIALYSFNHEVTLQSNFTRNPQRIQKALPHLRAEAGTSMYDAIILAADGLGDRQGRRVMVVITDGGDTTSYRSYHDALRAAHDADAILYAIVVMPITNDAGRNTGGENALTQISKSTGGRAFFPSTGPTLDRALSDILRDLRTQYLLGYYPKNLPESKDKFRRVSVKLSRPDLQASTRDGYYGDN